MRILQTALFIIAMLFMCLAEITPDMVMFSIHIFIFMIIPLTLTKACVIYSFYKNDVNKKQSFKISSIASLLTLFVGIPLFWIVFGSIINFARGYYNLLDFVEIIKNDFNNTHFIELFKTFNYSSELHLFVYSIIILTEIISFVIDYKIFSVKLGKSKKLLDIISITNIAIILIIYLIIIAYLLVK